MNGGNRLSRQTSFGLGHHFFLPKMGDSTILYISLALILIPTNPQDHAAKIVGVWPRCDQLRLPRSRVFRMSPILSTPQWKGFVGGSRWSFPCKSCFVPLYDVAFASAHLQKWTSARRLTYLFVHSYFYAVSVADAAWRMTNKCRACSACRLAETRSRSATEY